MQFIWVIFVVFLTTGARADAEEWKLSLGVGAANTSSTVEEQEEPLLTFTAPSIEVSAIYSLTDFWQIGLTTSWGPTFGHSEGMSHALNMNLEGRFILDALTWVPYLSFGSGGWARETFEEGSRQWRFDASVFGGFGVDYRPQRDWSVGLLARGHVMVTDLERTVGPFDAQLLLSIYLD